MYFRASQINVDHSLSIPSRKYGIGERSARKRDVSRATGMTPNVRNAQTISLLVHVSSRPLQSNETDTTAVTHYDGTPFRLELPASLLDVVRSPQCFLIQGWAAT